jgi:hypothetical protein
MTSEAPFTTEEVAELRKLLEVEKVRKIVQLYSHYMDGRKWKELSELYAEDAVGAWGPYGTWNGRAAIYKALVDAHVGRLPYDGFHVTTNVWVEVTGPDTAISRTYLTDMWPATELGPISHPNYPGNPVLLYAVYENDYKKVGGAWKISRSAINFTWPVRAVHEGFPRAVKPAAIG